MPAGDHRLWPEARDGDYGAASKGAAIAKSDGRRRPKRQSFTWIIDPASSGVVATAYRGA